jgi:hypothetical protein
MCLLELPGLVGVEERTENNEAVLWEKLKFMACLELAGRTVFTQLDDGVENANKVHKTSEARSNWKMGRSRPRNTLHTTVNVMKDASVCF